MMTLTFDPVGLDNDVSHSKLFYTFDAEFVTSYSRLTTYSQLLCLQDDKIFYIFDHLPFAGEW